jgi:hypothetical protein
MATDIIAVPANIVTDPTMDLLIMNIPVWLFIIIGILLFTIVSNIYWFRKRSIMGPVLGYNTALKLGKPVTLFLGKNKSFFIEYLEYYDKVLSYKDTTKLSKWLMESPKSGGRMGGLSTFLVRDDLDYTLDPVAELAICKLADRWNEKYANTNPINSYRDFAKLRDSGALEAEYPEGVEIPMYSIYDPSLIQKYLPRGRSSGIFGSNLTSRANALRKDKTQESKWAKYIPFAAMSGACILMLILSFMYGTSG